MFGTNQILKVVREDTGVLDVHSIFYTIQGEGPHAGRAALFVRLHGCSLACSWCDTEFENTREQWGPQAIFARGFELGVMTPPTGHALIVLTGGEPMRQPLKTFVHEAIVAGFEVQIETAGIHWQPELEPYLSCGLSIVCSPKTATVVPGIVRHACAFKYIISAREPADPDDGLPRFAVSQRGQPNRGRLFRTHFTRIFPHTVYVQPMDEGDIEQNRANQVRVVELVKKFNYRLSLQQHKILSLE